MTLVTPAKNGQIDEVKRILKEGEEFDFRNGRKARFYAVCNGHFDIVSIIDEYLDRQDAMLAKSIHEGQIDRALKILDGDADPNARDHEKVPVLIKASEMGHAKLVHELMVKGADVNAVTQTSRATALLVTTDIDVAKCLLDAGACVNAQILHGDTSLILASGRGDHIMVKLLLSYHANPNITDMSYETALIRACRFGKLKVVAVLLHYGVDVEVIDANGNTALMYAAMNGYTEIVDLILDGLPNPYVQNHDGQTALDLSKNIEISNMIQRYIYKRSMELIDHAANGNFHTVMDHIQGMCVDVNAKNSSGNTALMMAAANGHETIVNLLLHSDINARNNRGQTALLLSIKHSHVANTLMQNGADVNIRDVDNISAFMLAVEYKNLDLAKSLLLRSCDPNGVLSNGDTPFIRSVKNRYDIVRFFGNNVDGDATDKNGDTALHIAVALQDMAMIRYVLPKGINVKNKLGQTALMMACQSVSKNDITDLILQYAPDVNIQDSNGDTAAILCIKSKNGYALYKIVGAGADLSIQNDRNETALVLGVKSQNTNLVYVSYDAVNVQDRIGATALIYAAQQPNEEIFDLVLARSNVNLRMIDGNTALMACVGNPKYVNKLIHAGIDINAQNDDGQTALHIVFTYPNDKWWYTANILLANGAKILADIDGNTPLDEALSMKNKAGVELLCRYT
jgi:ankyrin repeat protein